MKDYVNHAHYHAVIHGLEMRVRHLEAELGPEGSLTWLDENQRENDGNRDIQHAERSQPEKCPAPARIVTV